MPVEEPPQDPIVALREAFAEIAERLTPDVEPAPIYSLPYPE